MKNKKEKAERKSLFVRVIIIILVIILAVLCFILGCLNQNKINNNNNDSNMGLVTQFDECIYYYKYNKGLMKKNKKEEKLLTEDQAYSINYYDGYIYYSSPNSLGGIDLKKISEDGKSEIVLLSTLSNSTKMYLKDNYIYYLTLNPNTISRIDINSNNQEIVLQREIEDFKIFEDKIYFSDKMNLLYSIDINGENYQTIFEEPNFNKFQILNGNVYYIDNNTNNLMSISLSNNSKKDIIIKNIDFDVYNVTTNGIYLLNKKSNNLELYTLKGKKQKDIAKIKTDNTKINIVDNIIIYNDNIDGKVITKMIKRNGKEVN